MNSSKFLQKMYCENSIAIQKLKQELYQQIFEHYLPNDLEKHSASIRSMSTLFLGRIYAPKSVSFPNLVQIECVEN